MTLKKIFNASLMVSLTLLDSCSSANDEPGDDYVDFIGMDCYNNDVATTMSTNMRMLQKVSEAKLKPCGTWNIKRNSLIISSAIEKNM